MPHQKRRQETKARIPREPRNGIEELEDLVSWRISFDVLMAADDQESSSLHLPLLLCISSSSLVVSFLFLSFLSEQLDSQGTLGFLKVWLNTAADTQPNKSCER